MIRNEEKNDIMNGWVMNEESTKDDRTSDKMHGIQWCTGDHGDAGIMEMRRTHWDRRMIRRMIGRREYEG